MARAATWMAIVVIAACRGDESGKVTPPTPATAPAVPLVIADAAVVVPDAAIAPAIPLPAGKLVLNDGRQDCAAVALDDGSVLVIGGYRHINRKGPGDGLASVERLDLRTVAISAAPPLAHWRYRHTATRLADGRVLVIGGVTDAEGGAEIYDPASQKWRELSSVPASWQRDRWGHSATLLVDGRVLVAGGIMSAENRVASEVDIFDPKTESWTTASPLHRARDEHTATLLRDGRVLVAGGRAFQPPIGSGIQYLADAEVYDPARDRWEAVPSMKLPRSDFGAGLLPDGRVLVAGGYRPEVAMADAEIFDPATGAWTPTAALAEGRFNHTVSVLEVGVVAAGGWQNTTNLATTEVFDPKTSTWRAGPKLRVERDNHCAVALPTGLLLFGGQNAKHFSAREVEAMPISAFAP
jgi:hypothetical protein